MFSIASNQFYELGIDKHHRKHHVWGKIETIPLLLSLRFISSRGFFFRLMFSAKSTA